MSGGTKAGGIALRLVLLALLFLGVGVLHTLSHAGAHGGVTASSAVQHGHQGEAAPAQGASAQEEPHSAATAVEVVDHGDVQRRVHAEGTDASDCFALMPSGSWLLGPYSTATGNCAEGLGTIRAGLPQDPGVSPGLSRLSVLRI
ncbi:putative secreted protein [Streptomyces davaonensis JCM 4913]|uniref:Putative secreted protein n=1 Tax=Streptomyces davaonensis (strain DSM 101723 / JCM 4913 / KCC S-0913 / 768) TaxID=1214101 RepID=K4QT54_STRDJ|nr:hypothetical protein [Streptomyces davaonensis]CCK25806.1 putative secreted protein [Streptomyces davaonensis JCM 4913]